MDSNIFSEEEIRLYNPAYTGYLLYSCLVEFTAVNPEGMHCAIPFISIPMAMSEQLVESYPNSYPTPLASWSTANEGLLIELPDYIEAYIPIVRSGLSYIFDRELAAISSSGRILCSGKSMVKNPSLFNKSESMNRALKASRFIGKWFSHAPNTETIFTQLGIRP